MHGTNDIKNYLEAYYLIGCGASHFNGGNACKIINVVREVVKATK